MTVTTNTNGHVVIPVSDIDEEITKSNILNVVSQVENRPCTYFYLTDGGTNGLGYVQCRITMSDGTTAVPNTSINIAVYYVDKLS